MEFYRDIRYLDRIIDGKKSDCVGFVKLEIWGEECRMHLQIRGLNQFMETTKQILVKSHQMEYVLGELDIRAGEGCLKTVLQLPNREHVKNWVKIWIPIAKDDVVAARFEGEPVDGKETLNDRNAESIANKETSSDRNEERIAGKETLSDRNEESIARADKVNENRVIEDRVTKDRTVEEQAMEEQAMEDQVIERADAPIDREKGLIDKWRQLQETYQVVTPFMDGKEYLKIRIEDLVTLSQKDLGKNSFLLHGYFQYKYLLLGKTANEKYFVGVPGVFFEKEKQAAQYFGFEMFLGEKEPAQPGDRGYYVKYVNL